MIYNPTNYFVHSFLSKIKNGTAKWCYIKYFMCFCGKKSFLKIKCLKFHVANFLKRQERERRKQQTQVRIKIVEGVVSEGIHLHCEMFYKQRLVFLTEMCVWKFFMCYNRWADLSELRPLRILRVLRTVCITFKLFGWSEHFYISELFWSGKNKLILWLC